MPLKIYNTLTRKKEEWVPRQAGHLRIYVCGVTVYDLCHIGHARAAVAFDVIVRFLRTRYKVTFVRNITDIDDKIIQRAREQKTPWADHARIYTERMHEDFAALGILPPDIEPKATDHIAEMIVLIEQLMEKGLAYVSEGDVFFSVRKFKSYGKLSGKTLDDLMAGARVAIDEKKADPLDFALWKSAKPDEPAWESPWGNGRPGWHIECSAMSQKYLGDSFDMHGGGRDLIFPHHENEIAQSEGATAKPFANLWLHNGFVTINKEKMSKSLGNFFTIREVLKKYHPEVVRLFLLSSHYRGPIDYSDEHLQEAHARVERVYQFKGRITRLEGTVAVPKELQEDLNGLRDLFTQAMEDDFNTPMALGHIFEVIRRTNTFLDNHPAGNRDFCARLRTTLEELCQPLGIFQMDPDAWLKRPSSGGEVDAKAVERLIEERAKVRQEKNWRRADEIRKTLEEMGVVLEDTPQGTTWRVKGATERA